jgi:hypothetical protein
MHVAFELTCAPVNLGVQETLGYFAYVHWDCPNFTKKNISYATVGLTTWFSGQGYIVEKYRQDHLESTATTRRWRAVYEKLKGGAKGVFERGLKSVEDEFGPLGGVRRKSEAERVGIVVGRLEKADMHPAWRRGTNYWSGWMDDLSVLSFCYGSLFWKYDSLAMIE